MESKIMTKSKRKKSKKDRCICEPVYDGLAIILDARCKIHNKRSSR